MAQHQSLFIQYIKKNRILSIVYLFIFSLSLIFGLVAIRVVQSTEEGHETNIHHETEGMSYLVDANSALWELRHGDLEYLSDPPEKKEIDRASYPNLISNIVRNFESFARLPQTSEEMLVIEDFRKNVNDYFSQRQKLLSLVDSGKGVEAIKYQNEKLIPLGDRATDSLSKVIKAHQNAAHIENTVTQKNLTWIKFAAIGYLVFTIALSVVLIRLLVRSFFQIEKSNLSMVHQAKMVSLGEMAGGIAHEINNPLAIIMAKASQMEMLMNKGNLNPEQAHKNLGIIMTTADRIAKIVRGLKSFARDTGTDPMVQVNLREIVEHVLSLCAEKLRIREIKVEVQVPAEIEIECRQTQMEQMLLSLITNAQEAVENLDVKLIRITAHQHEGHVILSIIDSGRGIHPAIAEKMMQPFYTTKEIGKGAGLGLSIAKGIVEAHHGQFFYDSKSLHTTFVIQMPLRQPQSEVKTA